MKRRKMSRKSSKRNFTRHAGAKAKNMVTPMRGGWRI